MQVPLHFMGDLYTPFADLESVDLEGLRSGAKGEEATPLLYETVQLRSKKTMKQLSRTVLRIPALGPLIRRLRIDAGYGSQMYDIVERAPNIRVLSVNLCDPSRTSLSGLLRSLRLLEFNPYTLYVHQ
ncbi:hypothetical protein BC629DRAFT_1535181, partial [Irpex lacteus]